MATRSNNRNRYFIRLSRGQEFKLSAAEWQELRAGGWIESDAPGSRYAVLRRGVVSWVRGCDLHLLALDRIRTASASWAHAWLYKVGLLRVGAGEPYFDRQERVMREFDRDLQNEALVWRTFRDKKTKGANSLVWIPSEHKHEIIRALKPDGVLGIETISWG